MGLLLLSPVLYGMFSSLLIWGSGNFAAPYDQYVSSSADLLAFDESVAEKHHAIAAFEFEWRRARRCTSHIAERPGEN